MTLNGQELEIKQLPFPGLSQGSPLSPISFLFYNADLVERRSTNREGAVAFIDDYSAWVVGRSAEENISGIREIVDHALGWELRSGATFEGEKTALVQFTRNSRLQSSKSISIKGIEVSPCKEAKILGVLMDSELRYKNHIKKVSGKGLKAALALKRMRALTPSAAC